MSDKGRKPCVGALDAVDSTIDTSARLDCIVDLFTATKKAIIAGKCNRPMYEAESSACGRRRVCHVGVQALDDVVSMGCVVLHAHVVPKVGNVVGEEECIEPMARSGQQSEYRDKGGMHLNGICKR